MKTLLLCLVALAVAPFLNAQTTLPGTWQGTLSVGPQTLRLVFNIAGTDDKLTATVYSVDQGGQAIPTGSVTKDGNTVKITIPAVGASFEGKLSADGNTITGTFTQGGALPLTLTRATPGKEWLP